MKKMGCIFSTIILALTCLVIVPTKKAQAMPVPQGNCISVSFATTEEQGTGYVVQNGCSVMQYVIFATPTMGGGTVMYIAGGTSEIVGWPNNQPYKVWACTSGAPYDPSGNPINYYSANVRCR